MWVIFRWSSALFAIFGGRLTPIRRVSHFLVGALVFVVTIFERKIITQNKPGGFRFRLGHPGQSVHIASDFPALDPVVHE